MARALAARPSIRPAWNQLVDARGAAIALTLGLLAAMLSAFTLGPAALILAAAVVIMAMPAFGRALIATMFLIAPLANPAIARAGSGRAYAVQICVAALVLAAAGASLYDKRRLVLLIPLATCILYVFAVGHAQASHPDVLAWTYKPIQLFLVAGSVPLLVHVRQVPRWLEVGLIGATVGCGLASLQAVFPAIDPFKFTRPADLPFVSRIGPFARATGAFVYPNNLGTFAAYAAVVALVALTHSGLRVRRSVALAGLGTSLAALLLSASRAAALGLSFAGLYVAFRSKLRTRLYLLGALMAFGVVAVWFVPHSAALKAVVAERLNTATTDSLSQRQEQWADAWRALRGSSLAWGTGVAESRTDNSWLLYLSTGGLIGLGLLLFLGLRLYRQATSDKGPLRVLAVSLLIAAASSAILQDTLGQTLTTWYLGAVLGLCSVSYGIRSRNSPDRASADAQPKPVVSVAIGDLGHRH